MTDAKLDAIIRATWSKGRMEVFNGPIMDWEYAIARAVRDATLEEAAKACESFGRAHTYASENADHYRGFDAGTFACAKRIRALKGAK